MKRSCVLAVALVITLASTGMAAEPDASGAQIVVHEKSEPRHVRKDATPETAAQTGCCACPADPTVTGDVYIGPISKYLFRGNDLSRSAAGSDFALQGGIDLTYKAFTLSYWGNALNRYSRGNPNNFDENGNFIAHKRAKINETDLILDYAVPYKLPYLDKVSFNVGTQYFAVEGIEDTNEFYLKATVDTLLKPTLTVYWDNMLATRAGLFYSAAIAHKIELEHNMFNLNLGALVSYNQRNPNAAYTAEGDGVYNGWHNYELTASIDYTPTANITITPSYMFSNGISKQAKAKVEDGGVGISAQNVFGIKALFSF